MHCRLFSNVLGLCPPDAYSVAPAVTTKTVSWTLPNIPWNIKSPPVEIEWKKIPIANDTSPSVSCVTLCSKWSTPLIIITAMCWVPTMSQSLDKRALFRNLRLKVQKLSPLGNMGKIKLTGNSVLGMNYRFEEKANEPGVRKYRQPGKLLPLRKFLSSRLWEVMSHLRAPA